MKISLVTPCFNCAAYIEETIESVLSQGIVDLEYFVIDGGSTDGTVDIIRRYESKLTGWLSEKDSGQVEALNKGFARVTGEILGFINADDFFLPGALKTVLDTFTAHPEADLVAGTLEWIDSTGNVTGTHRGHITNLDEALDIYRIWWGQRQWVQPEVFYRRTLKERVGEFDSRHQMAFDYDFWVRCFRAGAQVVHIPQPLVRFRQHENQKSRMIEASNDDIRSIVRQHLDDGAALSPSLRRLLESRLSYDLYQQKRGERPGFLRALAANPGWLRTPEVRERLAAACRRLISRRKHLASS